MFHNGRTYHLLDCGSWVNGAHEIGIIAGNEIAVGQWDLKGAALKGLKIRRPGPPKRKGARKARSGLRNCGLLIAECGLKKETPKSEIQSADAFCGQRP